MIQKPKLIRVTTVPISLKLLITGQMKFMSESGFEVIAVSADGKEIEEVKQNEGCTHITINLSRKITPFNDLKSLWQMYKLFKNQKPDIVHTHTPKAGLIGMLAAKMAGVKTRIHTVAGMPLMVYEGTMKKILIAVEKLTYWACTDVWPNSYSLNNYILENKFTEKSKIKIINKGSSNGIDLSRFSIESLNQEKLNTIKNEINYNSNEKIVVLIGRMVKDKGVEELVEAFKVLQSENIEFKLLLIGPFEHDLDPLNKEIAEEIENNPKIQHINWSDDVEYYMHLSYLLIHPSYREGFPNVLLQAGAMKCPVLCSEIPGNVDVANNRSEATWFKVKNKVDLYEKLKWALENENELKNRAENLYQKITKSFSRLEMHQAILEEYKRKLL